MSGKNKTIAVSGYFIWLHIGHLDYFKEALKYGKVIVIVNNDQQQINKYGEVIVPLKERIRLVENVKYVDQAVASIDKDGSVCATLTNLKPDFFGNGGDRNEKNIPEAEICRKNGIQLVCGLGRKVQSSSWLLNRVR